MDRFAHIVVAHRKLIIALFIVATLVCAPLILFVKINYNIVDYLPANAQSTRAIDVMGEEFDAVVPNTKVMVHDVSLPGALEYKEKLATVPGVSAVMWLDDVVDIKQPLEFADKATVEGFYKDGTALFDVTVKDGTELAAITEMQEIVGPDNAVGGDAPSLAAAQSAAGSEVMGAFIILIPAIILILALSTSSFIEPLLLLLSIGIAILLNMGSNIVYGNVSFISNSVSPILQMAVSIDYAIILLHSFADHRKQYDDPAVAMEHAITASFKAITASGAATLFGFLALVFMEFLVGADLGINLVKGILFSVISAMLFLPAITLSAVKLIDRTGHRPLLPNMKNAYRVISKLAIPVVLLVVVAIVPSYLGQSRTDFLYGAQSASGGTRVQHDTEAIEEEFGKSNVFVVLVPKGDVASEQQLSRKLEGLEHVTGVVSYANTVGAQIPTVIPGAAITSQFYSENYARIIIYTDAPEEGEVAFATVEAVQDTAREYYGEDVMSLGRTVNLYDMKFIIEMDDFRVNLIALLSILLVLLITFRSGLLPFLLLLTIEAAIWINLAIPYFQGTNINYIGYLVINTVQLGATVDYAILLATTYMRNRKDLPKREAIGVSLGSTLKTIIVSASALSVAGFALFYTSTNPIVQDIGLMLGRGTLISFGLVVFFLPALLRIFDPLIEKTTWKGNFFKQNPDKSRGSFKLRPKEDSNDS
jgi:predicted RND superfamily exporter protein